MLNAKEYIEFEKVDSIYHFNKNPGGRPIQTLHCQKIRFCFPDSLSPSSSQAINWMVAIAVKDVRAVLEIAGHRRSMGHISIQQYFHLKAQGSLVSASYS